MITQKKISSILQNYDVGQLTIGVLGGHSALDVCHGAKRFGFKTLVVAQKGREKTYEKYYKTRSFLPSEAKKNDGCCGGGCGDGGCDGGCEKDDGEGCGEASGGCGCGGCGGQRSGFQVGCVDEVLVVDKFKDIVKIQEELRKRNTIFIHNRYFWVYCDFDEIENDFAVPIFGNRVAVRLEERDQPNNQYELLKKAGIRMPKIFKKAADIDRLVLVKVNEELRGYERAFFFAANPEDFKKKSKELLASGSISQKGLDKAVIEEFIVGAQINLNYFYSPLTGQVELMGTDMRRQTNLDGLLRLPATEQLEVLKYMKPRLVETGHVAVTMKESLVEKAFDLGERFVKTMEKQVPPGMIGPFALQGAVAAEEGKEEFVIFDVSMRIPGSPGTRFTPYSGYLLGESFSYGERIALEIRTALGSGQLEKLVS